MWGLSATELIIVLVLALLLLGPDQLPSVAKTLGKGLRELRKHTDDLKSTFEQQIGSLDVDDAPRMIPPARAVEPRTSDAGAALSSLPAADPGAARAGARILAAGGAAAAGSAVGSAGAPGDGPFDAGLPPLPADPGAARAAARRFAAGQPLLPDPVRRAPGKVDGEAVVVARPAEGAVARRAPDAPVITGTTVQGPAVHGPTVGEGPAISGPTIEVDAEAAPADLAGQKP